MKRTRSGRARAARPGILAVIPVSGQDPEFRRGLPRLGDRSLLDFTFDAALAARRVTRVVVSTDDRRIADAARRAGIEVPFLRRPSARREPVVRALEQTVQALEGGHSPFVTEWVVRLQVTYPFRETGFIDRAIATVLAQDLDSAFVAFPEFDTFWYMNGGLPERITTDVRVPRARRRPIYRELGGLFSMVRRDVLARGTMYGERLGILPTASVVSAVDLHGVHGLDLARLIAGRQPRAVRAS
jgi:CMP-N-acetylneuraminic acid synthetase